MSFTEVVQKLSTDTAQLVLYGRVGREITAEGLERVMRQIGTKPLRITLNTDGGNLMEANRIYARLREHSDRHFVSITAIDAFSAGALIFLAAEHRCIAKNGTVMLHNVMTDPTTSRLSPAQLRELAASLEAMSSLIGDVIAERTGLERAEVFELMESECHLNAARAVELGFAHEIGEPIY